MNPYKTTGNKGLFDEQEQLVKLSEIGNPLEMISKVVDFEMFRAALEDAFLNKDKKNNDVAKPYDVVMMFKIIILQRYYGVGNKQLGYQIIDRASFKPFLGLESFYKVPEEKSYGHFVKF
jgi:hypothetical protein